MENVRKVTPSDSAGKVNFHTYWKIFWRKKYLFLVPLALSSVVSVVGVRYLTPIYKSRTLLSIEDKNVLSPTMERYVPVADDRNQSRNQQFKSMIETRVKSNDFLRLIVEDLGLQRSYQVRQYVESATRKGSGEVAIDDLVMRFLVTLLKKKIEVDNPMPGLFAVGVYDTDPATAYVLAEKVSEKFIDVTRQDQIQGIRQAGAFSDEQLGIYKEKLETAEKELALVKRELEESNIENNPVTESNITYAQVLKQTMGADVDRNGIALKRVKDRLVTLLDSLPSSDKIGSDETVRNCENKLEAFGEEKLLRDLSGDRQTPMPQERFDTATAELRNRVTAIVGAEYRNLSSDVYPLIVEYYYQRSLSDYYVFLERKLQGYLDQYSKSYDSKPGLERDFNRLTQEVETNRALYKAFLESKTSARISEAAQTTNLGLSMTIIERAEKPLAPVKPNPLKIIVLAVFFGGACGIGAILLTEYLDDSFRSIEEVERILEKPVLGTMPKMETDFAWEKKKRGVMIISWLVGAVLLIVVMSGALYFYAGYLKSSGLGLHLKSEQPATEVQP